MVTKIFQSPQRGPTKFLKSPVLVATKNFQSPQGVNKMGHGVAIENFQLPSYHH